jgi:hypothetical protein
VALAALRETLPQTRIQEALLVCFGETDYARYKKIFAQTDGVERG